MDSFCACLATGRTLSIGRLVVCLYVMALPLLSQALLNLQLTKHAHHAPALNKQLINTTAEPLRIEQQTLRQQAAGQLATLINHLGTVNSWDYYGDGSQTSFSLRGFGENASHNSLLLINGEPVMTADLGFDLNLLPMNTIQAIEILPNSQSVLYGDQAVGGVINIITKQAQTNNTRLSFLFGSYQQAAIQLSLARQFNQGINLQLLTQLQHGNNYRDHNKANQGSVYLNLNAPYRQHPWSLHLALLQRRLEFPGSLTAAQVAQNRRQSSTPNDWENEQKQFIQLANVIPLKQHWRLKLQQSFRHETSHGFMYSFYHKNTLWYRLHPELIILSYINKHQIKHHIGMSAQFEDYHYDSQSYQANIRDYSLAAYQQSRFALSKQQQLILGWRYIFSHLHMQNQSSLGLQQQHNTYHTLIKSIGWRWQVTSYMSTYLRRAENYRLPTSDENSFSLNGKPLALQRGVSYETGLHVIQKKWLFDQQLFALYINNEIAFAPQSLMPDSFTNQNLPPTRRLGISEHLRWQLLKNWQLQANMSAIQAKITDGPFRGNHIPFVPELTAKLGSTWQFANFWSLYLEAVYTSRRYPGSDVANQFTELPSQTLFNGALGFNYQRYHLSLRLDNLSNKYYVAYATTNGDTVGYYPATGRRFLVKLSIDV